MTGGFTRTADKTANSFKRTVPVALGTSAATAATVTPNQAHGRVGQNCLLTVGLDNSASDTTLTCQFWSEKAKQWFYAGTGESGGAQTVDVAPGGVTSFTLPEMTLYFLYGTGTVAKGLVWTDNEDIPATPETGTQ